MQRAVRDEHHDLTVGRERRSATSLEHRGRLRRDLAKTCPVGANDHDDAAGLAGRPSLERKQPAVA
jgi:hypothetical protein